MTWAVWTGWPGLAAVLALALAVRVALVLGFDRSVYGGILAPDEQTYDAWARAIIRGDSFRVYDQSSLPAYIMAVVYRLTGGAQDGVRALNVAWGVATCALAYGIGRELRGRAVGLLTALVVALYRPFAFFNATLLKESLGLFLCALMLFLFLRSLRADGRCRTWVLLAFGGTTALTLDVRQNMIAAVPIMAAFAAWFARRQAGAWLPALRALAAFTTGLALLLALRAAAAYRETGQLWPTPVGGFNVYLGNAPGGPVPYYRPVRFATTFPQEHAVHFTIEASRRVGHALSASEASSFWMREVIRSAVDHPGAFARRLGVKALAVLNRWEEADNRDVEFLAPHVPALRLPLLSFGLLLPLGLGGLVALVWRRDPLGLALSAIFVAYAATMIAVFPNMRIRAPLVLVLAPAAVTGAADLLTRFSLARAAALAALVIIFALVAYLPIPGSGDFTAALNGHANVLRARGDLAGAHACWRRSAELHGAYSDYALLGLAVEQLERGDPAAARRIVQQIPDDSFAAYNKYDLVADSWVEAGVPAEAERALRRSLAIDGANRYVHQKLIQVLEVLDPPRAEQARVDLANVETFYAASREGTP